MKPTRIFFSYAHEDENFREELEKHLAFLKKTKRIIGWHDRRISPGANWEQEINDNIDQAQIILMLISPDFINSDYCYDTESIRALERHRKGEARVIPVIIRPCLWRHTPFKDLQALPKDGQPVSEFANPDKAWLSVAEGLLSVLNEQLEENRVTEAEFAAVRPEPPNTGEAKNTEHEDQIVKFMSQYSKYWFSPGKIKSMADKVAGTKDLTSLEVNAIIEYCESLAKKELLSSMLNAKGNKIYKINN